jgi:hypothetical protein
MCQLLGRFEGNFPVRAMEEREGTELFSSVCPFSEKNSWRCSGGHTRPINFICMDIGIKGELMLPVKDKTVVFLRNT